MTQDLMIDLAPIIETDMCTPDIKINFLSKFDGRVVLSKKLLLVAKYRNDALQWRLSTSLAEREIFQKLSKREVVTVLLKQVKLAKLTDIKIEIPIKSYHLKTTLLHWLNECSERIFQWSKNKSILPLIIEFFEKLLSFIVNRSLPHFFYPDINLLADIDLDSENVRKFCDLIADKESFLKLLETDYTSSFIKDDHESEFLPLVPQANPSPSLQDQSGESFTSSSDIGVDIIDADLLKRLANILNEPNQSVSYSDIININKKLSAVDLNGRNIYSEYLMLLTEESGRKNSVPPVLHIAIVEGVEDMVKNFLDAGANVNEIADGKTPLYVAVENNRYTIAELLLNKGANVDCLFNGHITPLLCAVSLNFVEIASLLMRQNACVNAYSKNGISCLSLACFKGNIDIVQMLLDKGALVNARLANKSFANSLPLPIECAILSEHYNSLSDNSEKKVHDLVMLLLRYGAKVDVANGISTPLALAAELNYITLVELLLENGCNVNTQSSNGRTALISAASKGNVEAVFLLLKHKADVNKQDDNGMCAILVAAGNGHTEIVELLCEYDADVNCADNFSRVPLTQATKNNHDVTAAALLKHGVFVNVTDATGDSALHIAAVEGNFVIAQLLLRYKADVNQNSDDNTPLTLASTFNNINVARLLIESGADVNIKTGDDELTALHESTLKGWLEMVELLVDYGADLNSSAADGNTCFHIACQLGYIKIVQFLVSKGADVNLVCRARSTMKTDGEGETGFIRAARNGKFDIIKLLLERNSTEDDSQHIDVNFQSENGNTALLIAAFQGHYEMARILLEHGAKTEELSADGATALNIAVVFDHPAIASLLLDYGANVDFCRVMPDGGTLTPIAHAIFMGNKTIVKILVNRGADINAIFCLNGKPCTPLILAVLSNDTEMVNLLLTEKTDITVMHEEIGFSAIHAAAQGGNIDICTMLIDFVSENCKDVNICQQTYLKKITNARNTHGVTALAAAAEIGHLDVVQLLLDKGAEVNTVDAVGDYPLHVAASGGHLEIVQLLLSNGAHVDKRNNTGNTSLLNATDKGHKEVAAVLVNAGADVNVTNANNKSALRLAMTREDIYLVECLLQLHFPIQATK